MNSIKFDKDRDQNNYQYDCAAADYTAHFLF